MITFNSFLDPKYFPLVKSMEKKYRSQPRPISTKISNLGQDKRNFRIGSVVLVIEKKNYKKIM